MMWAFFGVFGLFMVGFFAFAYLKGRIYGRYVHGSWQTVADEYGLEVGRSGDAYAPALSGSVDTLGVEVYPHTERYGAERPQNRTSFEIELPEEVPMSLHVEGSQRAMVGPDGIGSRRLRDCFDLEAGEQTFETLRRDAEAAETLLELHDYKSHITLKGRTLSMTLVGRVARESTLREALELVLDAGRAIGEAFRSDANDWKEAG